MLPCSVPVRNKMCTRLYIKPVQSSRSACLEVEQECGVNKYIPGAEARFRLVPFSTLPFLLLFSLPLLQNYAHIRRYHVLYLASLLLFRPTALVLSVGLWKCTLDCCRSIQSINLSAGKQNVEQAATSVGPLAPSRGLFRTVATFWGAPGSPSWWPLAGRGRIGPFTSESGSA